MAEDGPWAAVSRAYGKDLELVTDGGDARRCQRAFVGIGG